MAIEAAEFVRVTLDPLRAGEPQRLANEVRARWTCEEVSSLLRHEDENVRRTAAGAIGVIGGRERLGCLARLLREDDPQLVELAEYALWMIWFRTGREEAHGPFRRGVDLLKQGEHTQAEAELGRAIEADPDFAEAYNQRAMARFMLERWDEAIADCREAVRLVPQHFGAWACLGHCLIYQRRCVEALAAYDRALAIHPHMQEVRCTRDRLATKLDEARHAPPHDPPHEPGTDDN